MASRRFIYLFIFGGGGGTTFCENFKNNPLFIFFKRMNKTIEQSVFNGVFLFGLNFYLTEYNLYIDI